MTKGTIPPSRIKLIARLRTVANFQKTTLGLLILAVIPLFNSSCSPKEGRSIPSLSHNDWKVRGGGPDAIRYSTLDQINKDNVSRLEVAWTYHSGDEYPDSEMQCNPIIIGDTLYATTPKLRVIALDAVTGKLRWSFSPFAGEKVLKGFEGKRRNRGVTYWEDGKEKRIFVSAKHYLYGLDAKTGNILQDFGNSGRVDLRKGFGRDPQKVSISASSPGTIYKDMIIMGSVLSEDLPAPPGDIRAYDVRSGDLRWTFRTIPNHGEFGHETWPANSREYLGGANSWAGLTVDHARGLVFCPTGSSAFDFYGANRLGDNLFANSLIALNANTGERVWHFQAVKHDVWDRDFPSLPSLVTVKRRGRLIDAIAQITKSGHVWVFNRETGEPLFPIKDLPVPPTDVEGEILAETQPLPVKPLPFARQIFTEDMITKRTPAAHKAVLEQFHKVNSGGQFIPPSLRGTIIFPGYDGGGEWGGGAFDPETGIFYVNSNEMPWILRLVERSAAGTQPSAQNLYLRNCASCHKKDRTGSPPEFPSLTGLGDRLAISEFISITAAGRGRMPGFSHLPTKNLDAIARYVMLGEDAKIELQTDPPYKKLKYATDGYNKFLDPGGYPAVEPPWGTLNAISLDTGEFLWKIPFGEFPELTMKGIHGTGSENYGGPIVTAGGILFIGATNYDKKFRAYNKLTGELLWETVLPAAGNATPATYEVGGRQFVVIGAGGGKWGSPSGGTYIAFSLPK